MNVPFLNLSAQYARIKTEVESAVLEVLSGGHYILGKNVEMLENEVASLCGVRYGIGVNSGSDALTLVLKALNIKPGDEVITTPFTYIAPAESIYQMGAKIVFADIDERTFNINPQDIAKKITKNTRAIIPVHLFGQPADINAIFNLIKNTDIKIVEDCAQAIGALYHDKPVGSFGVAGCISFYPTKNLGAAGDGGMIVVNDSALAASLKMIRVHGISKRYHHDIHGYNSRLDEIQAAILRVKLKYLSQWNNRRIEIAKIYNDGLNGLPIQTPFVIDNVKHVYHVYAILTDKRDELQQHLSDRGIPTIIYYPKPLHLQTVYSDSGYKEGDLPVAEKISRKILPLPMYPELTDEQVNYVIDSIRSFRF
ncbi:MAG: DegT/DnrJ/EryC1/StrS family aminotransferase [Verrucomicrobiae bacterium]|nr:DegT/DnrJ/EryC1/StrS family aminotransferase [Verrucomicrobiae bacterium]